MSVGFQPQLFLQNPDPRRHPYLFQHAGDSIQVSGHRHIEGPVHQPLEQDGGMAPSVLQRQFLSLQAIDRL